MNGLGVMFPLWSFAPGLDPAVAGAWILLGPTLSLRINNNDNNNTPEILCCGITGPTVLGEAEPIWLRARRWLKFQ